RERGAPARYGCPDPIKSCPAEGRHAPPPHGAGRYCNRDRLAARRFGEQRDPRRLAPRDHGRDPPAARADRGCWGRDRLDRQEPLASGSQEMGGASLRRGPIFRTIDKGGTVRTTRLTDRSVANIVAYASRAGFDASVSSGHSLRAGFLTSA